jgi:uncharacterized membrane protein
MADPSATPTVVQNGSNFYDDGSLVVYRRLAQRVADFRAMIAAKSVEHSVPADVFDLRSVPGSPPYTEPDAGIVLLVAYVLRLHVKGMVADGYMTHPELSYPARWSTCVRSNSFRDSLFYPGNSTQTLEICEIA